jgi:hypothetical protein
VPEGVIVGGWSFVAAAYGITAAVLTLYVWSLARRTAAAGREDGDDD